MFDQALTKSNFVGREYLWWIGQIASEVSWRNNIPGVPSEDNNEFIGFGERYRVAIMGYQPFDLEEVKDEELIWAYVAYPVTAGSGGRSSGASSNLVQGDFVYGFFLDGDEAQIPVIDKVIGRNEYQDILKNKPEKVRFLNYSGFLPDDYAPWFSQRSFDGGEFFSLEVTDTNKGLEFIPGLLEEGQKNNDKLTEAQTASNSLIELASECASEELGQPIAESEDCEPTPLPRVLKQIQNIITELQRIQKGIYTYNAAAKNQIAEIQNFINNKINEAAKFIAGGIKWVILQIEKFVIKSTNDKLKLAYFALFPNERPLLKIQVESLNDGIACVFRKIIGSLFDLTLNFLQDAVGKVLDAGQCIVENFVAAIFGDIIGQVTEAVNGILSDISDLLGQTFSLAGDILQIIIDVLSFISCDDKPQCTEINEWNILSGGLKLPNFNLDNIKAKIGNINFDNVFDDITCDIGPSLLGPPTIQFTGGVGALANAIISPQGELLSVDVVDPGTDFTATATAQVVDAGGKGKGAVVTPVVGSFVNSQGQQQTGVVSVIVNSPGAGFLPAPNGSTGSNGFTFSNPEDTIVKRSDGTFEPAIPPGNVVTVVPGDEVTLPVTTNVVTNPIEGGQGGNETILGGSPVVVQNPGTLTSPKPNFEELNGEFPVDSTGSYPVILYLEGIIVEEPGINYNAGNNEINGGQDTQQLTPSIDDRGRIVNTTLTTGTIVEASLPVQDQSNPTNQGTSTSQGKPSLNAGGTGGIPATSGGSQLIAGGTGGIPITVGATGGTPINVDVSGGGIQLLSEGQPVTIGGFGGTPVTTGGVGGVIITVGGSGGTPVLIGGSGGSPVTSGGNTILVGGEDDDTSGLPVTTGTTPQTGGNIIPGTNIPIPGVPSITIPDNVQTPDVGSGVPGGVVVPDSGNIPGGINLPGGGNIPGGGNVTTERPIPEVGGGIPGGASVPTVGGDVVVIEPNNGAVVEPIFDGQGRVTSVKVIDGGEGFTEFPNIFIQSETGFNAILRPKLSIDRVGINQFRNPNLNSRVIKVVDCVGKF